MPALPADPPPVVIVVDNLDLLRHDQKPSPYPNIDKYRRIERQRLQQAINQLAPKAATDPDAARRYRELNEQNDRTIQILTDPNRD